MFRKVVVGAAVVLGLTVAAAHAGTPFGGDDTGFIPPGGTKGAAYKCESKVSKNVANLVKCIAGCHDKRAAGKLADDTAEDACEQVNGKNGCFDKYNKVASKITGCPACANGPTLPNLVEGLVDGANSLVYCASPSGAFLNVVE